MTESLFVFLFVILGIVIRYALDKVFAIPEKTKFPWVTFFVNILGCSFLALIYVLIKRETQISLQPVWLLSLCIGFTLFSAYAIHTMKSYEKTRSLATLVYFLISPTLGLIVAFLTLLFVNRFT